MIVIPNDEWSRIFRSRVSATTFCSIFTILVRCRLPTWAEAGLGSKILGKTRANR